MSRIFTVSVSSVDPHDVAKVEITGTVCGVRVQDVEDPLMQKNLRSKPAAKHIA